MIDLSFDLTINKNHWLMMRRQWDPGTLTPLTRLTRQWDPGIAKDEIDRSFCLPTSHSSGVVVNRSFHLPTSHSNGVVVDRSFCLPMSHSNVVVVDCSFCLPTSHSNVVVVTMVQTNQSVELNLRALPATPHAEAMLTPSLATCNPNLLFHCSHPVSSHLWDPTAVRMTTVRCGALALIQLLFQRSHPVLSWPKVPNIQQCCNNLPSPSSI